MNWIEEAIQPPSTGRSHNLPRPVSLLRDAKGRVVFRVDYNGGVAGAHISVRVRILQGYGPTWLAVQRYEVGDPLEHSRDVRAALVRMYTELFEDRCEQTGIACVNERRKEMKRWLSMTSDPKGS